jgi:CheY-like chemotaxis protein
MKTSPVTVLLVEDDDIDIEAVRRAFHEKKILNPMRIARDGVEALEILRGQNGQEPISTPYMILLDINMPRMNGFEFLDVIRSDPKLKKAVVFVLTTSDDDQDMMRAYERNVAGYIVKSEAGSGFLDAVALFDHYWRVVELPKG